MSEQYFARIDSDNKVIDMAVTTAEFMAANPDRYPGTWVETFFDRADKQYANIGFSYNPAIQDFTAPPVITI
jgi:hypothetical protein